MENENITAIFMIGSGVCPGGAAPLTAYPGRLRSGEPPVVAPAECKTAIEALGGNELRILKRHARTLTLRGSCYYADSEDLLHEAIARTLDGRRKWRRQRVDLVMHLKGCMRSIADGYDAEARKRSDKPPDHVTCGEEERFLRQAMLRRVRVALKPDALALGVFNALLAGHTPREVRSLLNIKEEVYDAARKRISRRVEATGARKENPAIVWLLPRVRSSPSRWAAQRQVPECCASLLAA